MEAHVAPPLGVPARLPAVRLRVAGDERLAQLASAGSDAAFAVLFQRFHQPLYRYCRSLLGNDADAQDALQTTFTQALVALREDRRTAPLRPWLYRIAHNESISLLRRRRPAQELPNDAVSATERSPHEVVEERARLATLVADLGDLPDRQRGALVMRELSGLPHEEIAQAFGISVGAAKQTVLEARRTLAEFAEGRSMACDEIQRIVSDGDRRALRGRRVRAHLRDCAACQAFATAIPARQAELRALSPALPMAAAVGLLARITGIGSSQGGSGAGVVAGATSKAVALVGSAKTVATGAAVVAVAAVGAGEIHHLVNRAAPGAHTRAGAPAATPAAHAEPARHIAPAAHRAGPAIRAEASAPATPARHAAAESLRTHRHAPAHRHRATGAAAAGTAAVKAVTSPGRSGTHGQGAIHRAAAAARPHGASATSPHDAAATSPHGASATAPGHVRHAGAATAKHRGVSRVVHSSRGNSTHAKPRGNSKGSHAAPAGNGSAAHGNSPRGKAAAVVSLVPVAATSPGHSGH